MNKFYATVINSILATTKGFGGFAACKNLFISGPLSPKLSKAFVSISPIFLSNSCNQINNDYGTTLNQLNMQSITQTNKSNTKTGSGFMRWVLPIVVMMMAIALPIQKSLAQVNLYSWASGTGASFETITSPTVLTTVTNGTADDGGNLITPSPAFTFRYNGVDYTQFGAGTNGYVRMGSTVSTGILGTLSSAGINGVFVFCRDGNLNVTSGGSMTHGPATGGKYVFHFVKYSGGSGGVESATIYADIQVVLWGSTSATPGRIEIIWGTSAGTAAGAGAMGIVDAANTFVNGTNGNTATATNPTNWVASGTKYTFTPPPPCAAPVDQSGTPSIGVTTFSSIAGSFTAAGSSPSGYLVVRYPSGSGTTNPVNGTTYTAGTALGAGTVVSSGSGLTFTAGGLVAGTTYDFYVYSFNNTACSGGNTYNTTSPASAPGSTPTGSLSGTKTVGTGGDYDNLTTAFAAINASGLSGNIDLQLITGYPAAAETYPIKSATAGAGGGFNINVYPTVSGLSITSANATGTLRLDSAAKITFDGRVNATGSTKDLIIANTVTTGYAINFVNDANNNTIKYCTIRSVNTSTTSGTITFTTGIAGGTGNDNNTIDNNDILDGATTPVNAIYSAGTSAAVDNSGNTVSNNNIANFFSAASVTNGMLLTSTGNSTWSVTSNRFYQGATRVYTTGNTHNVISIQSGGGYTITGNTIGYANSGGTGSYNMIGNSVTLSGFPTSYTTTGTATTTRLIAINLAFTAGAAVSSIQNNTVAGIALFTSSGAGTTNGILCGINLTSGNANIGTTTGNTIGATSGNSALYAACTSAGGAVVGIYATSTGTVTIQNNNIGAIDAVGTTSTLSGAFTGIDVAGTGGLFNISSNNIGNTTANNIRTGYLGATLGTGGSITTTTGSTSPMVGIRHTATGAGVTISSNTLRGWQNGTTGGGAVTGITSSGSVTNFTTISSNALGTSGLGWMTWQFANTGGTLTGISATGSSTADSLHLIENNDFRGITYTVSGSSAHTYITLTGATGVRDSSSIKGNTFTNLNVNTTGSVTFINHGYSVSSTGRQYITNNSINTTFNKGGAGGTITGLTSGSSSATGAICKHMDNTFSNITATGATAITGINNTDGASSGATRTVTGNNFSKWTNEGGVITGMR